MDKERLKSIIKEHNLSYARLSEISGVSKRTIEGWFAKDKGFNPTINEFSKVANALGVSLDVLVGITPLSEPEIFYAKYSRHKALLAQIDKLDLKSAELINEIVEVFYKHNKK